MYATVLLVLCLAEGASVFSPPKRLVRGLLRAWLPPVACSLVLVELFVPGMPREELTSRVKVEPGFPADRAGVRATGAGVWLTAIALSGSAVWPVTLLASLVITLVSLRRTNEAPRR